MKAMLPPPANFKSTRCGQIKEKKNADDSYVASEHRAVGLSYNTHNF